MHHVEQISSDTIWRELRRWHAEAGGHRPLGTWEGSINFANDIIYAPLV
jgi:hypothetical protein